MVEFGLPVCSSTHEWALSLSEVERVGAPDWRLHQLCVSGSGALGVCCGVFLADCFVCSGHLLENWSSHRETFLSWCLMEVSGAVLCSEEGGQICLNVQVCVEGLSAPENPHCTAQVKPQGHQCSAFWVHPARDKKCSHPLQ